jgi:formate--tetrahydrofolate ligase
MLSDIEIAQKAKIKPIETIASELGISSDDLELYGRYKAKVSLEVLKRFNKKSNGKPSPCTQGRGKYILVSAITPTPLGEGKTVTTIGLSMALNKLGSKAAACIRQPSLGPVFGIKGGAAGGGYSQVVPMEDFNLHLTGDVHAVGVAHNLLAAFLDNSIFKGNRLNIDPSTIIWRRVVDVSDRFLRHIIIGLGGKDDGLRRESGFDITVASEVMAILALTDSLSDLRKRLGRIVVADTYDGRPITAEELKVAGAMAVLLKDAIKPNLLQTLENTPCFVHTGPFANIAHGNSSILADKIALKLVDYVVTESGFGADCGAEKFFNIKCRYSGLIPDAVVIVCSIRALKMHSGHFRVVAGRPLDEGLLKENLNAVKIGSINLEKQIENMRLFGVPVIVAINEFATDTKDEIELVKKKAKGAGAEEAVVSQLWAKGGSGGRELAEAVIKVADKNLNRFTPLEISNSTRETKSLTGFNFLYPLSLPIKEKIEIIATKIYGAKSVEYSPLAEEKIKTYTQRGWDKFPICMAKTHLSLSHDPNLKGRPTGFVLPIRDIRPAIGAGFLYPLCGSMQTMPGLPSHPVGENIDIDEKGRVVGLS